MKKRRSASPPLPPLSQLRLDFTAPARVAAHPEPRPGVGGHLMLVHSGRVFESATDACRATHPLKLTCVAMQKDNTAETLSRLLQTVVLF